MKGRWDIFSSDGDVGMELWEAFFLYAWQLSPPIVCNLYDKSFI